MKHPHVTNVTRRGLDYFTATLDNGGVRFGLIGLPAVDFQPDHPDYVRVQALVDSGAAFDANADSYFDELVERGLIPLT